MKGSTVKRKKITAFDLASIKNWGSLGKQDSIDELNELEVLNRKPLEIVEDPRTTNKMKQMLADVRGGVRQSRSQSFANAGSASY